MKSRKSRKYNHLFFTYRAAMKGDTQAAQFLLGLALIQLEKGIPMPPGLHRYFVSIVRNPDRYHEIMTYKRKSKTKKGRPSANARSEPIDYGLRSRFTLKQYLATEQYALAMTYLLSLGHPINSATTGEMESATAILSKLTRRSERSLQNDYYVHREALGHGGDVLSQGNLELARLKRLYELRKRPKRP